MAAGVTIAEQPSESGEMGSCGRLPRSPRRVSWASWSPSRPRLLSPLSESGELVSVGLSRNTGGGGESGESVAAKGRVGCSGALGPLGAATPAELGPSGAKQRLWQPPLRELTSSGASLWSAIPRLCFYPPGMVVGANNCAVGGEFRVAFRA